MIIVYLTGGLGNQMFQYAAARRLAEKHSTILKLDVSGFETYKLHRYSLHCFHIWEYLATQTEVDTCLGKIGNKITRLVNHSKLLIDIRKFSNKNLWREKYLHFNPAILDAPNNSYLDGYWQSEKYFFDIEDIVKRDFTIKYTQDSKSHELSQIIQDTQSVSLHIRRADYVKDLVTYQVHGVCSLDYYAQSIDYIAQRVNNPHFFIFSDDPQWAKENLKINFPVTIVDHNDASKNYEDLRLMSQCKHNIIANSSFSWWGAWLNSHPDKMICAPKKWFNDSTINAQDLIPERWVKI